MSTLEVALARIAALEARVAALESGSVGTSTASNGDSSDVRREMPIDDHQLDNSWADKKVTKDPKKWKGPTQVGKTYSRAPIEWLEMAAASLEYKAHMGRLENPPRLSNKVRNGKPVPWHESDSFEARIIRGWVERKKKRGAAKPAPAAEPGGDDDFNFGANTKAPETPKDEPADDIGF